MKATSEMITDAEFDHAVGSTALAVSSHTPSTPSGFGLGATIQGWRPISVKIQPNSAARNGIGSAITPSLPNHGLSEIRPLRVYHSAARASSGREHREADHQAERPVGHREVGHEVDVPDRRAVLLGVLRLEVLDARQRGVEVALGEERGQAGDREDVLDRVGVVGQVADRQEREVRASGRRLRQRLGGRHLHRLLVEHHLGLPVTGQRDADAGDDQDARCRARSPGARRPWPRSLPGAGVLDHPPDGDAGDERAGGDQRGEDHVREGGKCRRVEQHLADRGHLGAAAVRRTARRRSGAASRSWRPG